MTETASASPLAVVIADRGHIPRTPQPVPRQLTRYPEEIPCSRATPSRCRRSGSRNLAAKPPWHYAGTVVAVEFWADPAATAATLPEGLTPDPDSNGHGLALFIDWQFNGSREEYLDPLRSQYHEFFVLLDASWQDTPVSWCPYIYVDNDHAMARGWIQGFPKKLGVVAQTHTFAGPNQAAPALAAGGKFGATAATAGYRLANAQVTLQAPVTDTSTMIGRPTVNLRHFPNLTAGEQDKPAVHELVMAIYDNQTITDAWAGKGVSLFAGRTILSGSGDELVELARDNLR
jgi:acetoacetate decarboxylase